MKNIIVASAFVLASLPTAQAAEGDTPITFQGNIQVEKIAKSLKVAVSCAIVDKSKQVLQANGKGLTNTHIVGPAGADGKYNGPFSVTVNIPAASMVQVGTQIAGWKCSAMYYEPTSDKFGALSDGAMPLLSGTF